MVAVSHVNGESECVGGGDGAFVHVDAYDVGVDVVECFGDAGKHADAAADGDPDAGFKEALWFVAPADMDGALGVFALELLHDATVCDVDFESFAMFKVANNGVSGDGVAAPGIFDGGFFCAVEEEDGGFVGVFAVYELSHAQEDEVWLDAFFAEVGDELFGEELGDTFAQADV